MNNLRDVSKTWEGQIVDGKFLLRRWLGGSDHSAVFLTERAGPESEKAAIKFIPADGQNAEAQLSRWALAAGLSHPHLIRVFQSARCRLGNTELLYVLMEYAEEDLSQILPQRPLTPEEILDMLPPVLEALSYIHGKGLLHGHIKPPNIMAIDNQVKVSSDGLYRAGEPNGIRTNLSVYDAPEITAGNRSQEADIWSVGMTLVAALTQHPLIWEGTENGSPILPETMPEPFRDIAIRCLRLAPERRCTLADIKARLQPAWPVAEQPVTAKPQKVSANWRLIVPIMAGLLLLAVLAGQRISSRRQAAPLAQTTVDKDQVARSTPPSPVPVVPEADTKNGHSRGAVLQQVLPEVPRSARNTIQGKIKVSVRVAVDPSGNVSATRLVSPGPSQYFAKLAMKAARSWKFTPPQTGGQNVASEWILRFQFGRTLIHAIPVQTAP
jgi:TonB family protein